MDAQKTANADRHRKAMAQLRQQGDAQRTLIKRTAGGRWPGLTDR